MAKRPMPTFDPSDEWFRRPDVWSGLVLGAWALVGGGKPSVVIAIVDDGIDIDHPDLKANIWANPNRRSRALCSRNC